MITYITANTGYMKDNVTCIMGYAVNNDKYKRNIVSCSW